MARVEVRAAAQLAPERRDGAGVDAVRHHVKAVKHAADLGHASDARRHDLVRSVGACCSLRSASPLALPYACQPHDL